MSTGVGGIGGIAFYYYYIPTYQVFKWFSSLGFFFKQKFIKKEIGFAEFCFAGGTGLECPLRSALPLPRLLELPSRLSRAIRLNPGHLGEKICWVFSGVPLRPGW